MNKSALLFASLMTIATAPAVADPFLFNTGNVNGLMAAATRPSSAGKFEIEAGDDFIVSSQTKLNSATFTGLIPTGANVSSVRVEIYRVFPARFQCRADVGAADVFNLASSYARELSVRRSI